MTRSRFLICFCAGCVLFLGSCATTTGGKGNSPACTYDVSISSESSPDILEMTASVLAKESALPLLDGIDGVSLHIKNTTAVPVQIDWDRSSVAYNGSAHAPFIGAFEDGTKTLDPMARIQPTVVPGGAEITQVVYSCTQPVFYGTTLGWRMTKLKASPILITLAVSAGDENASYAIKITAK
jgi:hypothetical protein